MQPGSTSHFCRQSALEILLGQMIFLRQMQALTLEPNVVQQRGEMGQGLSPVERAHHSLAIAAQHMKTTNRVVP
jgi:hypothetical protein